jgi:hypothetical protein
MRNLSIFFTLFLGILFGSETVISANAFQAVCDFSIDRHSPPLDPALVKKGDSIFVNTSCLDNFFALTFPHISEPFILVSGSGFGNLDNRYLSYLENPLLIHWFGNHLTIQSPKATTIPLGGAWYSQKLVAGLEPKLAVLKKESYFGKKPFSMYVNWTSKMHPSREGIFRHFASLKNSKVSSRVSFQKYMQEMGQSRFAISPRGVNIDCFRTWEALYVGSIPVVESWGIDRVYEDLPVIIVNDLTTVTESYLQQEYERLKLKSFCLEKLTMEYWIEQIDNYKKTARF